MNGLLSSFSYTYIYIYYSLFLCADIPNVNLMLIVKII